MALDIWANGVATKPRGFMKQTQKPAGLIRGLGHFFVDKIEDPFLAFQFFLESFSLVTSLVGI
jgi:hypothetical protein